MAVVTLAIERGLLTRGHDPWSGLLIDTLVGPIPVRVEVVAGGPSTGRAPALRVARVAYESPPARVTTGGLPVSLPGRTLRVDLVSCAGLFAIADSESAGVPLSSDALPELRRAAMLVSDAVGTSARRAPKARREDDQVTVVFIGPSNSGSSDLRSATVFPGGQVSLAPSGRATAAVVAVLDAMGVLPGDRPFTNEGLLGLALEGRVVRRSADAPAALTVEIAGTAWPTGDHEFVFRPDDPLGM
jgi:proline racemase